ncbi:MAG: hypothetical protein METHP_00219 [Methanoregula sp. SKADARSKE-2]|nr:MAG: hypothetical protein METHP_00219 [Methanoregula sp. SKADARSKE-2]
MDEPHRSPTIHDIRRAIKNTSLNGIPMVREVSGVREYQGSGESGEASNGCRNGGVRDDGVSF